MNGRQINGPSPPPGIPIPVINIEEFDSAESDGDVEPEGGQGQAVEVQEGQNDGGGEADAESQVGGDESPKPDAGDGASEADAEDEGDDDDDEIPTEHVITRVISGSPVATVWVMKDWITEHEKLYDGASCSHRMDFSGCQGTGNCNLFFFLVPHYPYPPPEGVDPEYLSLMVSILRSTLPFIVPVSFTLTTATPNVEGINHLKNQFVSLKSTKDFSGRVLIEKFIPYKKDKKLLITAQDLNIKFIVTPENLLTTQLPGPPPPGHETFAPVALLGLELGAFYTTEENLFDVELIMKDGNVLCAHRFILGARSPYLKELMFRETQKPKFNGLIRIDEINSTPMRDILHWMYTADILVSHETLYYTSEMLEACRFLQMDPNGFRNDVDRQVMELCTLENMYELTAMANDNDLPRTRTRLARMVEDIRNPQPI